MAMITSCLILLRIYTVRVKRGLKGFIGLLSLHHINVFLKRLVVFGVLEIFLLVQQQ